MTSRLVAVALDSRDPEALATFWCAALGYRVHEPVVRCGGHRLRRDRGRRRRSAAHEVARLVGLGASVRDDNPALSWAVLADPEGNEFCVLPPRS